MDIKFEQQKFKQGFRFVIGCDEVGRGSLAGPVVAATVLVASDKLKVCKVIKSQVKDSKQLSPKKREELASFIKQNFLCAIGEVSHKIIDEINIHNATLLAMKKAVIKLTSAYSHELAYKEQRGLLAIDGRFVIPNFVPIVIGTSKGKPKFDMEQEAIVKGDNKIFSIAAASIVAKVYRDELMRKMNIKYPQYGFAKHKGYGTLRHRNMVKQYGLSSLHRKSFCKKLI
ncbi:MAG: ribonuclease HII [Candidatus Doudnabacteria bacterium]|jgi:ribonuclease HII